MSPPAAATAGDLASVRALLEAARLPPAGLEHCLPHCLVVRDDGRVIAAGAVEACGDAWLLRSLVVAPERRARGLGAGLLGALEARARAQGAATLWLLTDGASDWFAAHGYRARERDAAPAGIRAHAQFRELCPASALLMSRTLGADMPPC